MATAVITLLATGILVGVAIASDDVNLALLKERIVPSSSTRAFAFKLCGKTMHGEITDVMFAGNGFVPDPKMASIWCKAGLEKSNLNSDLRVYVVQETDSSGKATFKTPPNPEYKQGVNLPPSAVKAACKKNASPSDDELKAAVSEVLKMANSEYIDFVKLKKKLVPTTKHTFTFTLCGTKLHAQIADVMAKGIDFFSSDPKLAAVWVKYSFDENKLGSSTFSVYLIQETSSRRKITYKTPPNSEDLEGVFLPDPLLILAACGTNISGSVEERKAIANEVLKKANAA